MITNQVEVLLPTALDHGFDYRVPGGMSLQAGDIVSVPFGRGESLGVAWGKGQADIAPGKLKSVARHHDFPPLSPVLREFIDWVAWYNCAAKGAVLKMLMPIADIDKAGRKTTAAIETGDDKAIRLAPLSEIQREAEDELQATLGNGFSVTLLDGVTGSGKTEVYFSAIAHALKQNGHNQVLVLLPEIALSVQWLDRFEKRFGFIPPVWNSEITHAKKRATWQAIARGEARVVIGARSALFLPYRKLALLVVDEEHDTSYKQEEGVIYHARDMAVARARFEQVPAVLVSATPSLESYYNVKQGKYREVCLPHRHGGAVLPDIAMVDMRSAEIERGAFISAPLRKALAESIGSGHQAMLFLNRRGYAPLMLCRHCGYRFQCPQCSAWMVLHKGKGIRHEASDIREDSFPNAPSLMPDAYLNCHHCNDRIPVPDACPACGARGSLHACGPGVERVHEEVKAFLPQARIAVMASDQMGSYGELSDTINAMAEKRIDVLIGTQMIAKGHHFAGLNVVGVVDADLGLAGGDLRAAERTYQLLHQLSGRAGREQVRGTVYLQSFLPGHPVMKALISGERNAFMAAELEARKAAHMPPFSRLAALIVEGAKEDQVMRVAKQLAASAGMQAKMHILGPAPAPLFLLRGKFRYRLLVKADRAINLPDYLRQWVDSVTPPSSVRVKIDIDPVSFV